MTKECLAARERLHAEDARMRKGYVRQIVERIEVADDPIQREADREASQREARLRGWRKTGLWMAGWGPEPPAEERLKAG